MNIDLDIEPTRPAREPDKDRDRPREPRAKVTPPTLDARAWDRDTGTRKTGHRREHDARLGRRVMADRMDAMMRDVGTFRTVALADLIKHQFGGHPYAAREGLKAAERAGWIVRQDGIGPKGGHFKVIVATEAGAARARELWANVGTRDQRVFRGAVKQAELRHECDVYKATYAEIAKIREAGGHVHRVRVDAELKGQIATATERARRHGPEAAMAARRETAAELGLSVTENGRVLFPDAQIEFVDAHGLTGRASVEVASEHYRGGSLNAKAAAGFTLYAAAGKAAAHVRSLLSGATSGGTGSRRSGRSRDVEVFEL